jgi:DNA-binding transcriptional LysR family regulator
MLLSPHDLQILVRLGDGMSQSQIGNDLGLEQPAVSKAIHAAEQRLGLSLVHSDGRRVKLTNVGREVAQAAADVLLRIKGFDDLVGLLRAGRLKHTRIVASHTPGTYLLPDVVADFLRSHDDAQVDIEVVSMNRVWDEFVSGAYDLAFTPKLPFRGTVRTEALCTDPVLFFAAPGHRLAGRRDVPFAEMRDALLVGKFSDGYWGRVKADLDQRGCSFAQCVDLDSPEAVKRVVLSGIGPGMLFASALQKELASGELIAFTVDGIVHEQTYYLVRPATELSPLAERFCTFMRERLGAVPA